MEISKMLTVSTGHISKETSELLENDKLDIVVFDKGEWGWFIHIPDDYDDFDLPIELHKLMNFAKDLNCDWLCLDCDGDVLDYFEVFDW